MANKIQAEEIRTLAERLAGVVDAAAGDYPVLCISKGRQAGLNWNYGRLALKVVVDPSCISVQYNKQLQTLKVPSLRFAFAIVAATEQIRQGRPHPYVQYLAPSQIKC